jgi:hypothetical protein
MPFLRALHVLLLYPDHHDAIERKGRKRDKGGEQHIDLCIETDKTLQD